MPTLILRPNAAGDLCSAVVIRVGDVCPDAYKNVDDVTPDGTATMSYYNWPYPQTDYTHDSYNIENHTIETGVITNVRLYAYLRDNAPSDVYRRAASSLSLRISGTNYYPHYTQENPFKVTSSWAYYYKDWATNPATGLPWTWADIDALQVGMGLMNPWRPRTGWTDKFTYVSQMYVEVEFSVAIPTVTTNPATSVAASSAALNGKLDSDGGEACQCGFEWGETIAYGNTTPTQSKTSGQTFAQTISGLDPKKTYHFRAFATNEAGPGYGTDRTFTTLAVAPTVATNPAIDISNNSATLKGELTYDGGEACNCGFEYGETEAYGTTTPTQSKVTGEAFSQPITGLDPNKTYHFRAIATNSVGTSHGADRTFLTLASAPAVTTNPATGLGAVLATLNGTLDDDIGEACECGFEWGLDTNYGTITPTESKETSDSFSQVIGGLISNTVYHFRAFATNSFGTGYGADRTFTTALVISRAYALARREL